MPAKGARILLLDPLSNGGPSFYELPKLCDQKLLCKAPKEARRRRFAQGYGFSSEEVGKQVRSAPTVAINPLMRGIQDSEKYRLIGIITVLA